MANRRLWVALFALLSALVPNACGTRTDSESHFEQALKCSSNAECPKGPCVSGLCVAFPPIQPMSASAPDSSSEAEPVMTSSAPAAEGPASESEPAPEMTGSMSESEAQPSDQEEEPQNPAPPMADDETGPEPPKPPGGPEAIPWTEWYFAGFHGNRQGVLERYVLGPDLSFTWYSSRRGGESVCKNDLPPCAPGVICVEQLRQALSNKDVVAARDKQIWGIDHLSGPGSLVFEFDEYLFDIEIEQNGVRKLLRINPACKYKEPGDLRPCVEVPAGLAELRGQFTALVKQQIQLGECADIPPYAPPGVDAGVADAGVDSGVDDAGPD